MALVTLDGSPLPQPSRVIVRNRRSSRATVINGGEQISRRAKGREFEIEYGSGRVARREDLAAILPEFDDATHTLAIDFIVGASVISTISTTVLWAEDVDFAVRAGLNAERFSLLFVEAP